MSDDGKDVEERVGLLSPRKKFIDGYDGETKKFIETLNAGVFSVNNSRGTLHFHDDYYVETVSGKEQNHSCAVSTVEFDSNGSDSKTDRIVFETNTGTHITTFTPVISADNASTSECTIASTSIFKLIDIPYERKDAVREINVTGLNSEVTKLLDDTDEMKKQLSDWCSIHFPVAATVTWIGACSIDCNEDTISTAFTIGNSNSNGAAGNTGASASVTYNHSERRYSLSIQTIGSGREMK